MEEGHHFALSSVAAARVTCTGICTGIVLLVILGVSITVGSIGGTDGGEVGASVRLLAVPSGIFSHGPLVPSNIQLILNLPAESITFETIADYEMCSGLWYNDSYVCSGIDVASATAACPRWYDLSNEPTELEEYELECFIVSPYTVHPGMNYQNRFCG